MRNRCKGFTLLEVMVVLLLIGTVLGLSSFAVGPNPARLAREEANSLVRLIQQLRERAVLEGREYGLRLSGEGYSAVRLENSRWTSVSAFCSWPQDLTLRLELEGQDLRLGSEEGAAQILMLSSDEVSEFTLTFFISEQTLLSVFSDGIGEVGIDG